MKVSCIACNGEVNLDHSIFDTYEGPVKCFSCGTMMVVKTAEGLVAHIALPRGPAAHSDQTGPIVESAART